MKLKEGFLMRQVAGQTVVLPSGDDLDLNMMITLNETGAFLWERLNEETTQEALVAALLKHTQPVSKITIVPHTTGALGYTMYTPEEEKFLATNEELAVELCSMLGGRAAEQLVFGVKTTGAANDIQRATNLAQHMVAMYGMSEELGLMAPAKTANAYLDGQSYLDCSQETSAKVDAAVSRLLNKSFDTASTLLRDNRALLDEISEYLLVKETITGEELMAYVNADKNPAPVEETED